MTKKISKEQIEKLKEQHGEIFKIEVEEKWCVLKKMDRQTLSYVVANMSQDPLNTTMFVIKKCFVAGDESFKQDAELHLAAVGAVQEMINVREGQLVKL